MKPRFSAGNNIAMKVPYHEFEQTVAFYRDILELPQQAAASSDADTARFEFGDKTLWVDRVPTLSQTEIWLEIVADDIDAAARYFEDQGYARRDEIEPLPDGFRGFWISSPTNVIHLVSANGS